MKATGIVRRVDDLGRIVIPKEIRRTLRIREGDPSRTTLILFDRFCLAIHSVANRVIRNNLKKTFLYAMIQKDNTFEMEEHNVDGLVFYCANCKQSFAGEEYRVSDRPRCPRCNKKTLSTGITKESWVQKSKEERKVILEALITECEQREQNIAKREEYAQSIGVAYKEKDKDSKDSSIDNLYIDIGQKIKGWARWIFIVGAISSVIGAISMLFSAEDGWMITVGLLVLVIGPLLAWVSSWILYAFGELVEKTSANEQNTRNILKLMLENNAQKEKD